ncbi:MAG TPA: flavin reductase family protein [Gemmatimonadaceae bacterium]|nr:flavin reductase family protein [Gemmatimonadaceae bacterium]
MIDQHTFRSVLGRFATGVTVITAIGSSGEDHGMTASAFSSVSLVPPLILACVAESADMVGILATAEHFGINILSEEQEALSRRFAEDEEDRFDGVGYTRGVTGVALLDNAIAHLECRIVDRHTAGDHTIVIGEVIEASAANTRPLIYYRGGYARLER